MNFSNVDIIENEFNDLRINPILKFGLTVGLINENDYRNWKLTLIPPKDSKYANSIYSLSINFPGGYPNEPPIICFNTPIYHLNINPYAPRIPGDCPLGYVCIIPLGLWKPGDKIRETLINIYSLFYYENPSCTFGNERLNEFRNYRNIYEEKKVYFTKKYADYSKNEIPSNSEDWNFYLF